MAITTLKEAVRAENLACTELGAYLATFSPPLTIAQVLYPQPMETLPPDVRPFIIEKIGGESGAAAFFGYFSLYLYDEPAEGDWRIHAICDILRSYWNGKHLSLHPEGKHIYWHRVRVEGRAAIIADEDMGGLHQAQLHFSVGGV